MREIAHSIHRRVTVLTQQIDYYHCLFPKDRRFLKSLVYFLYLWDIAQTLLFTQQVFDDLAEGWGDPSALEASGTTWFSVPIMSGVGERLCMLRCLNSGSRSTILSECHRPMLLLLESFQSQ